MWKNWELKKVKLIIQKKSENIFIWSDFGLIVKSITIREKTNIINYN